VHGFYVAGPGMMHSDTSVFSDKLSASNLFHNKFELYVII